MNSECHSQLDYVRPHVHRQCQRSYSDRERVRRDLCVILDILEQTHFLTGRARTVWSGNNVCGDSGNLPPVTEDCQTIFNAITILNGSICTSLDLVAPFTCRALTLVRSPLVRGRPEPRPDAHIRDVPLLLPELLAPPDVELLALVRE